MGAGALLASASSKKSAPAPVTSGTKAGAQAQKAGVAPPSIRVPIAIANLKSATAASQKSIPVPAPKLAPVSGKLQPIILPKPAAPPPLPTLAQLLSDSGAALKSDPVLGPLYASRPAWNGQPDAINAWLETNLNAHHLSNLDVIRLYPEMGWWRNRVPPDGHPETLFRCQYKLSGSGEAGGAVNWWVNNDGSWGYDHVWQNFDLWADIGSLAAELQDAASWLSDHLGHIDWEAVATDIEAAASVVPVLGTAVSDIVATVQVIAEDLSAGTALEKAIMAAFDYALASVPGAAVLHDVLDPIVGGIVDMVTKGDNVTKAIVEQIADQAPTSPSFAGISPRSVAVSLLCIVAKYVHIQT